MHSLLSDNGAEMVNWLMYEIVKVIVIDRHKCTPPHPEIDGMIEKWFSTNSNLMSTIVDSNQTNLDELIPYVAYASKLQ